MNQNEISNSFLTEDRRARDALERKRDDLERARSLSPALVASLEAELSTCEAALEKARTAGAEYDRESVEHARATARRQAALTVANTSHEVDPDAAASILQTAEVAKYLEGARKRRADAARDAAASGYNRVCKDIPERNAAVNFAERLAGATIDRAETPKETRPGVIAWLPLVFPVEGRAAYQRSYDYRADHPSYDRPQPVEAYDDACKSFFAGVERLRIAAAKQASDLAAVTAAE
jgi:hypothetical protein